MCIYHDRGIRGASDVPRHCPSTPERRQTCESGPCGGLPNFACSYIIGLVLRAVWVNLRSLYNTSTVGARGHHPRRRQRRAIRGPKVAAAAAACDDDGNERLRCVLVWPSQKLIMVNRLWDGRDEFVGEGPGEKLELLFYSGMRAGLDAAGRVDLGEGRSYPLAKIQKRYNGDRVGNQLKGRRTCAGQTQNWAKYCLFPCNDCDCACF